MSRAARKAPDVRRFEVPFQFGELGGRNFFARLILLVDHLISIGKLLKIVFKKSVTNIMPKCLAWKAPAKNSVCPANGIPKALIDSLLTGAVTSAVISFLFIPRFIIFAISNFFSILEQRGIIPRSPRIKSYRFFETGIKTGSLGL